MRSTFFGLEMGRRALQAQQRALDVTGHNISNANTPGYSRQEAVLKTSNPYTVPGYNKPSGPGQVGTGVDIKEIRRIRDLFIDTQVRTENKSLGYWEAKKDALQKIEVIVNEPSDSGVRSVLDQFWESWQELSKNPQSVSVRSVVYQRGIAVAETFNHLDKLYSELQKDINSSIEVKVNDINSIARQIGDINAQVIALEANGDNANDLRDKRDLLIDQLSKITDVQSYENDLGAVNVRVAGTDIIVGSRVSELAIEVDPATGYNNIKWLSTGLPAVFNSGEIKGLLEARGDGTPLVGIIPSLRNDLDILASNIITQVNAVHSAGYDLGGNTGINFFSGTDAGDISIDAAITGGLDAIAASNEAPVAGVPVVGNGENAIDIAQIKQTLYVLAPGFTGTMDDYYRSQIGKIGVDTQEASRMVDNQTLLIEQLDQRRLTVSGVSLDEEMTNMMKFQHGYNAAAKIVNTVDEMLDVIINRLGAGR